VKALVTGGTGFVGPKVVHALRAEGKDVRALVRSSGRGRQLEAWGCELVTGDLGDPESLRQAVEGCDAVVHLVAIIVGKPADFVRVMEEGTHSLVAAAAEAGVRRFVLMSALGTSEETKGLVPYYHAKWEMERAVRDAAVEHVIFRPSFVFGRDGGLLPTLVRQVRWLPATPVVGPGTQRIQPIWVDDVGAFFARSLNQPEAAGRTFDLGGPDIVTWNELFDRIVRVLSVRRGRVHLPVGLVRAGAVAAELLPKPPVTRDQLTMLAAGDNVGDVGPARELFGIEPIGLDEQLRRAA
jgi:NADH dehydrogenase